jgi:hypothetical protein
MEGAAEAHRGVTAFAEDGALSSIGPIMRECDGWTWGRGAERVRDLA